MQRAMIGVTATALLFGAAGLLPAQNPGGPVTVHRKSDPKKSVRGSLESESVEGVRLKGELRTVPAEDIADVDYSDQIGNLVTTGRYREAVLAERDARLAKKPEDRVTKLKEAAAGYKEALDKMDAKLTDARRHAAFKIAYVNALLGLALGKDGDRAQAAKQLTKFKNENKDSWQMIYTLQTLARLQAADKDLDAARKSLDELAAANVSDQAKHEARFLLAGLLMEANKYAEAGKIYQDLAAKLPKDSPLAAKAQLAEAQAFAAGSDKLDEAAAKLKAILDGSADKNLRATAYNALGEVYFRRDRFQEARWYFLWVDVIYNQDKDEHAKALYYLWRTFTNLNEPERGQEFYSALVNGPAYVGSEFRRKAQEEAKKLQ